MERTIRATGARTHFGELMRRIVEERETVIVERGGTPQIVVLSIAEGEGPGD
ncbi:MAG: type II toxin-antitoxin system Phd/YefM family antitoxin [Chloroflexota bacterium]|nr:type II toxin-antitoxin system Phd/YefM family antitoxin [Chloroflexota bacterium]